MNDPLLTKWREVAWRRALTPTEEAEVRSNIEAHPELRAEWELERALTERLASLPDVPVASNFTARLTQAVAQLDATRAAGKHRAWPWRSLLPRIAIACVAVMLGVLGFQQHRWNQRAQQARDLAAASALAAASDPQILQNFDVILGLGRTPEPDVELLALGLQ